VAFYVYILYSRKLDKYYIGNTSLHPSERLEEHNTVRNPNAFTSKGIPWDLYYFIQCESRIQARRIEAHIKRMKSKRYIQNLSVYPEIERRLLEKYADQG